MKIKEYYVKISLITLGTLGILSYIGIGYVNLKNKQEINKLRTKLAAKSIETPIPSGVTYPILECSLGPENNYNCRSTPKFTLATGISWIWTATFDSPNYSYASDDLRSTMVIDDEPKRYLFTSTYSPISRGTITKGNIYSITFTGTSYILTSTYWNQKPK